MEDQSRNSQKTKQQKNFSQFLIDLGSVGVSENNQNQDDCSEEEEVSNDIQQILIVRKNIFILKRAAIVTIYVWKMKLMYLYQHLVSHREYQNLIVIKILFILQN